jgi:hypothetical protein
MARWLGSISAHKDRIKIYSTNVSIFFFFFLNFQNLKIEFFFFLNNGLDWVRRVRTKESWVRTVGY